MRPTILVNVYDWKILMTRETEQLISAQGRAGDDADPSLERAIDRQAHGEEFLQRRHGDNRDEGGKPDRTGEIDKQHQ